MTDAKTTILAATDLTPESHAVVTFAAKLAAKMGAPLELMHATDMAPIDPEWVGSEAVRPYVEGLRVRVQSRLAEAEAALEKEREHAQSLGAECVARVVEGPAWQEIVHRTERSGEGEPPTDLVIVGTHTPEPGEVWKSPMRDRVFGSTADRVVRHADASVWVVPTGDRGELADDPFARWFVALDFSPVSLEAVKRTSPTVIATGGEMALAYVLQSAPMGKSDDEGWKTQLREALTAEAKRQLEEVAAGIDGLEASTHVLLEEGRVHEELLSEASRQGATCMVLGARGHSRIDQLLLGSTSERCLRGAQIPVLISRDVA